MIRKKELQTLSSGSRSVSFPAQGVQLPLEQQELHITCSGFCHLQFIAEQ